MSVGKNKIEIKSDLLVIVAFVHYVRDSRLITHFAAGVPYDIRVNHNNMPMCVG